MNSYEKRATCNVQVALCLWMYAWHPQNTNDSAYYYIFKRLSQRRVILFRSRIFRLQARWIESVEPSYIRDWVYFILSLFVYGLEFSYILFPIIYKKRKGKKKQKVFLFGSCPKEDRWDRPPLLCAPQGRPPPSDAGSSLHPNRTWIYDSCAVLVLYLFTPTGNYYYYLRLNNKFTMTIKFVDIRWIK